MKIKKNKIQIKQNADVIKYKHENTKPTYYKYDKMQSEQNTKPIKYKKFQNANTTK